MAGRMKRQGCKSVNTTGEDFLTIALQYRDMTQTAFSTRTESAACLLPPETASPTRPQRLSDLASRLARTIGLARALVQGGRQLDLTGIDDGIGVLCAQTLDLPPDQAQMMLPLLWDMRTQIDSLTAALRGGASPSGHRPC